MELKPKKNYYEQGITLIALVVTIIVLLILAGISINMVLGDKGIINKAKEASNIYAQAEDNDISTMSKYKEAILDQRDNIDEIEITKENQNLVRTY